MITAFMTSREMYWKTRTGTAPVAKNRAVVAERRRQLLERVDGDQHEDVHAGPEHDHAVAPERGTESGAHIPQHQGVQDMQIGLDRALLPWSRREGGHRFDLALPGCFDEKRGQSALTGAPPPVGVRW